MAKIGEKLRKLRQSKGWTQSELAERSDMEQSRICKYEKINEYVTVMRLSKIARALGTTLEELLKNVG